MGKLDGKIAVLTGASEGMALRTAQVFVREGAYVFITGRRKDKLGDAVDAIGGNVTAVQADSSNLDDLDRLYETVAREKGHIDIVVANAGVGPFVPLGEVTEEIYDEMFDLNTRGTFFVVQKALPSLTDGASVIMTGSVLSMMAQPGTSVYGATKAALASFARVWMQEQKARRIRFNVLSPGGIDTAPMRSMPADMRSAFQARIPAERFGHVDEIAATALFLASDDGAYVNGIELAVDGGLSPATM